MNTISKKLEYNTVEQNLNRLGLSEKESQVYLALLRFDVAVGTSKIIRATGLHGQYVYDALTALEEKGLARHSVVRGRRKYVAGPPARLRYLAEEKRLVAESLATQLAEQFAHRTDQTVHVYEGVTAFVAHQYELLSEEWQDGDTKFIDVVGGGGERYLETFGEEIKRFDAERTKRGILTRYLGTKEQTEYFDRRNKEYGSFQFRIFPGLTPGLVDTHIRPTAITLCTYGDPVVAMTIRNKDVAARYRDFFNVLWKLAVEPGRE